MSIISAGGAVVGAGGIAGPYEIERSLRFSGAFPATPSYLNRTPGAPTNNLKWTFSFWVKRGVLGVGQHILNGGTGTSASEDYLVFLTTNKLAFFQGNGTTTIIATDAVFRDPSAWYHIVLVYDSAQATSTNRLFIYVNGVSQSFSSTTYPTLNQSTNINANGVLQRISSRTYLDDEGLDGYMTEMHFVDGQALDETDFGEFSPTTGVWGPIAYTGTYGTNGFYLNFSDNSGTTSTTLGKDQVGSNNWTPDGFSVTAGAGNDSLVDVPTLFGTDTGIGGEVRGNYATWNPLDQLDGSLANGNLDSTTGTSGGSNCRGTFGMSTGKFYFEVTPTSNGGIANIGISVFPGSDPKNGTFFTYQADNGDKGTNAGASAFGAAYTTNDVIGVAYDADAGKVWFAKNNVYQASGNPVAGTNEAFSGILTPAFPFLSDRNVSGVCTAVLNAGQRAFAHTAPSGYKALVTTNLPDPTVIEGDEYFNTALYTGTGAANTVTVSGFDFTTDLWWMKARNDANNHYLQDVVRGFGANKSISSNTTGAEGFNGNPATQSLSVSSTGYSVSGSDFNGNSVGETYVTWCWKANGAGVSNTAGTISSTVSANTDAGFSIVTYTGTGAASATIGHGLGVAPSMLIVKNRTDGATLWSVYHASVGAGSVAHLNTTAAFSASGDWNSTTPTSTVFSTNNSDRTNKSGSALVAYCFADIPGYSAFGSYTGNGSANGPFVFTGFRPAFVMAKRTDSTGFWVMLDDMRPGFNVTNQVVYANSAIAESTAQATDFLSNGFKPRTTDSDVNSSGGTHVYMAFAENPFKFALAR